MSEEVLPHEITIVDPATEINPLQHSKNACITKVRMLITPELSKIAGLALYSFTILNNDLASQGYFITDKNREETYLKILETGDERLVQLLEDYLNYRDEIEHVASLERKFSAFQTKVKAASTTDEVHDLEQAFLVDFYDLY